MSKEGLTRREFLWPILPGLIAGPVLFLSGCKTEGAPSQIEPPLKSKELEDKPRMGDVVVVGGEAFLLRNDNLYPIPDLEIYKRNTKLEQYGRRVMESPKNIFNDYSLAKLPDFALVIDPFTGGLKDSKTFGGEINVYFGGFMTDGGEPFTEIRPTEETFIKLRDGMKTKRFGIEDNFFFTYGERGINPQTGLSEYKAQHTARDPSVNIGIALEFFQTLKELFPLCQFNLIAHSLGSIFALEVAKKHYDAINNVILINGPVRGMEKNLFRTFMVDRLHEILYPILGAEYVTKYLFNLQKDKEYQKDLDEFGLLMTSPALSRGLYVVYDENDPIVDPKSTRIKGAKLIKITRDKDEPASFFDLKAHGRPLRDTKTVSRIVEIIGENLAKTG